ncbi:carbohydrate esterase family 4 protein [Mycena maculata]|uniref:chitin deacetylase n=1 Tax=Mycena maculata TaxID=230809 RepID=A0AAD7JB09_9AGAR|nr:carbohydrate esterase family 4 protein [Mycena maculata]
MHFRSTLVPTDEASEAAIQDPATECINYYWPALGNANATGTWPIVWLPVTQIPANDTVAQQKFASMNATIPNIAPKGPLGGSLMTATYDVSADPDCWWSVTQCTTPKLQGLSADIASVPEPRTLGYGFDDGPNCSHNAFYDYLTAQNQKATMFYIGSSVSIWPYQAQRAVTDGHEICVHTWSHRNMTMFSNEGAFAELYYTLEAIKLATGFTPQCWRPPFGDVDDRIRYIASQLGLETIIWKYDSFDYVTSLPETTIQGNYDYLISNLTAGTFDTVGAIMLTHELTNFTMQLAVHNYPMLAAAFDHLVPISVAMNKTQPYVESNFTMQSFADYAAGHPKPSASNSSSGGSNGTTGGSVAGSSAGVTVQPHNAVVLVLALLGTACYL